MSLQNFLEEEQLINQAVEVLIDKLGIHETIRFLACTSQSKQDSVKKHHEWQMKLNKNRFFSEVFGSSMKSSPVRIVAFNNKRDAIKPLIRRKTLRLVINNVKK